ncbi:SHOCT domain-containing protein [Arthrobacter sp. JCM 19049]
MTQKLEELASLRDRGMISETEFEEKRRSFLERM